MREEFGERLKQLRSKKGITQQQLASMMYIDRSSIARWESGLRAPDLALLPRLAKCLGVEVSSLLPDESLPRQAQTVIVVDDEPPILSGELKTLRMALPGSELSGFTRPSEALDFASNHRVDLAFLDIEMGKASGFELCEKLLAMSPATSVVYLTAFPNYALNAWSTGARGFLVKPLVENELTGLLDRLKLSPPQPKRRKGGQGDD